MSLFERYAKGGDSTELRAAGKTLPTLRHHLEMAQELDKAPKRWTVQQMTTNFTMI